MNFMWIALIVLINSLNTFAQNDGRLGSQCIIKSSGTAGICTIANNCELMLDKRPTPPPQICSYLLTTAVVCCEPQNIKSENIPNSKRISEQKCDEYTNIVKHLPLFQTPPIRVKRILDSYSFPHMATIVWTGSDANVELKCGGSLISEKFIITSAQCLSDRNTLPDYVRLSEFKPPNNKIEQFKIERVILHPDYKPLSVYNDIALIELTRNVVFKPHIHPACLWQSPTNNNPLATVSILKEYDYRGKPYEILEGVLMNVISNTECNVNLPVNQKLPRGVVESQMCLRYSDAMENKCFRYQGGPIQITDPNSSVYHIIGIESNNLPCSTTIIDASTRVSTYIDWIESIVWAKI